MEKYSFSLNPGYIQFFPHWLYQNLVGFKLGDLQWDPRILCALLVSS